MTEEDRKKLVKKLKRFLPALKKAGKVVGLYAVINFCAPSAQAQTHSLSDKDPTPSTASYTAPTERVHYQVDTMARGEKRALGSHSTSRNTITINHSRTDKEFNRRSHSMETLIHEHQHQIAASKGVYDYPVSLEQAYMLDMHDEIAANIAVLLYKRAEYIRTGNLAVFDGFFSYYKDNIIAGKINPKSTAREDFEKDMSVIADMTRIMWLANYGTQESYKAQHFRNACIYGEESGRHKKFWNDNYMIAMKKIYDIGGIDFTQFMEKDTVYMVNGVVTPAKNVKDSTIGADEQKKYLNIKDIMVPRNAKKEFAKKQRIPAYSELATENKPINKSKISTEAQYPKWSPDKRVSPIQYAQVPVPNVIVPEGYFDQPVVEEIPQQPEKVTNKNKSGKKKKEKKQNGWNEFWEKVGKFFEPKKIEKPAPAKPVTQTPSPEPAPAKTTVQTSAPQPSYVRTYSQNNTADTLTGQQPQVDDNAHTTKTKKTFKEGWDDFIKKAGDVLRPWWKDKPQDATADTATAAPQPVAVDVQNLEPTVSPQPENLPEQPTVSSDQPAQTADRISPQQTKTKKLQNKIKKQKTARIKATKQKYREDNSRERTPAATKTQRKDYEKMKKEIEQYKS